MSLLLCRRERVKHPFYIEVLGIHIYSSQELCYVIYHHPLLVMNDFADASLFSFIKNELGLGFLAGRMEKLIKGLWKQRKIKRKRKTSGQKFTRTWVQLMSRCSSSISLTRHTILLLS